MSVATPRDLAELRAFRGEHPESTLLAGGTDLTVEINLHGRRPNHVVSLGGIAELRRWTVVGERLRIGSMVPWAEMERGDLARLAPALAEAARTVGSPQIRAAGTLGGNLGTCSPAGDGLPVLAALEATIEIDGPDGARSTSFADFMTGVKRNSLRTGEYVVAVDLPIVDGWQGYAKVGTRNAMVIATASVCLVRDSRNGTLAVALGAVGPTIIRCHDAERFLVERHDLRDSTPPNDELVSEFGRLIAGASRPIDDHRSSADYRRHAVGVLARRLLERSYP